MGPFSEPETVFDRVEFIDEDGSERRLSYGEWEKFPIAQKTRVVFARQKRSLRFFKGDREVTLKEVLDIM